MTPEQLVGRYSARFNRLRLTTAAAVARAWDQTGGLTQDNAAEFAPLAAGIVTAAQGAQVLTTAAYYEAMDDLVTSDGTRVPLNPDDFARPRGIDPTDEYRRPIIQARAAITRGYTFDEAMDQGRNRATSLAVTDISLVQSMATTDAIAFLPAVFGFVRVLTGHSCPICVSAAGSFGRTERLPIHTHCDCSCAPVYSNLNPALTVNAAAASERGELEPVDAQVEQHGELGPVLVDGDDDFSDF